MKTLDEDKSRELLMKVAFDDNTCPLELQDIGREILTKCKGLPLAITVVGGLLLEQRQSRIGWEKVLQEINSHFEKSGSSSIQSILELSYHDLPPHLKSCFLCLGFFKEDATIRANKLVCIWIAEGLIQKEGEMIMEDISRSYLDELINRNMIRVKDFKSDGRVKSCQIHDLLRDLSIRKAKEEINFEILGDRGNNTAKSLGHKTRHCAIYGGTEGLGLRKLPDTIGELVGLRHLGLRDNELEELPRSISRLKNLQVPLEMGTLKNIQTLKYVTESKGMLKHLIRMTSLRNLGIRLEQDPDVSELYTTLAMLENLACLSLVVSYFPVPSLDGLVSLHHLAHLKLPKLLYLELDEAYQGEEMVILHEGFPSLKVLHLRKLRELRNMKLQKGGMSELKRLEIFRCTDLEGLPEELKFMSSLEELKVGTTAEKASVFRDSNSYIISNTTSVTVDLIGGKWRGRGTAAALSPMDMISCLSPC
ncbi:hypothetical protein CDL12_03075 [Handroanthus impetiginosus]|uniref:Uncharacterized protein n=1 Tax=Handroanthus impetiginosus TaxID=429701 RepID=A0A2G9I359_9LAMI|nr:hypothetical protein CDL12_03075 [Handroanthus impetiginosus]